MAHGKTVKTLTVLVFVMLACISFPQAAHAEESMLISSIEAPLELNNWWSSNGPNSLSTDHVTHGTYSMRIDYAPLSLPELAFQYDSVDVSAYDKIKLDVYLEGTPVVVTAKFYRSGWGDPYRSWYYLIEEGQHTIEYAIHGLASIIDTSQLFRISFRADTAYVGTNQATIYVDNLRATRGTNDDEWLRNTNPGHPLITVPGNVVGNGDFELGLQGWGSWGTWESGKYIFGSGTGDNAKSGVYSAKMTCLTEGRGGIWSSVDLEPGDYDLTFWVKGSGPSTEMFYYFSGSIISSGSSCPRTAVGTSWTEKQYSVTVTGTGTVSLYLFSTGINKVYFDAVSLVRTDYSGGSPPTPPELTPRIVTVDGQNVLVDGQPFFPIGIYGGVPSVLAASTGFNMVSTDAKLTTLEALDECETYGMMTWGDLSGVARGHAPSQAALAASHMKNHPAILCWYNCDEPDHHSWNVPPPEIRFMSTVLGEMDANHPTASVMMPWAPSNMYQYAHTIDISMIDPYSTDISVVIDQIDTQRDAVGPDSPMWIVLLSNYDSGTGPVPVLEYLYATTYGAITHTANGLFWFSYNPGSYPVAWVAITNISLELEELAPALTSETSSKVVSVSDPNVHTILKEYDGKLCLIAVNIGSTAANSAQLTIPGITATEARVKFEDRTETVVAGVITDDFAPHQRHVYEVGRGFSELADFFAQWLNTSCGPGNNWCEGADADNSTTVDFDDYAAFAAGWWLY
ncbi:MAG: carbohydrate binding domain-containing protein [Planctomycetota bacterium]